MKRFLENKFVLLILLSASVYAGFTLTGELGITEKAYNPAKDSLRFAGETHLRNITQMTFGGNNAEAYWSFDNEQLIFQSDWDKINPRDCDQIFVMNADGSKLPDGQKYRLVSTGKGRTTCSYFLKDGGIVFASTQAEQKECPEPIMFKNGKYVWPLYESYDIYKAAKDGSNLKVLIGHDGYDAEATVSPNGRYIVFTSTRSGDIELWRYEIETGDLLQLTDELGYDGGAFFSHNSKKIVWRTSRPKGKKAEVYKALLSQNLVQPSALNIWVMDADGSNKHQVTDLPGANWAPYFHPSNEKIIFSTNHHTLDEGGREFDLFMINIDGTNLTRITHSGTFDAFPMFSYDGSKIAFSSNRKINRDPTEETNVFIADWVENPEEVDKNFKTIEIE